jgi:hypothetical protein
MFHEPLTGYPSLSSWYSIALPENMEDSLWALPLLGERSYALQDLRSHQTRFPRYNSLDQPRPLCWLREPLQIVDEPHIRPATNPIKEIGATKSLFSGELALP